MAILAGTVSSVLFAASTLPMLIKAARTRELSSYSRGNLVLANVGNLVHTLYVAQLPAGPIWALHSFYVVSSALMLVWHLRYANASPRSDGIPSTSRSTTMTIEQIETAIIGAGQAGLATAYHLQRRGRSCLVLDSNQRVGDNWRAQWDSLRLYSPAGYDGLPGLPFPGPRWSYPTKDEVADYLARYADEFELPVRTGVRVDRLEATPSGYALRIGADTVLAENVVVATGTLGTHPEDPRLRAGAGPGDPPTALQRVPSARSAAARAGPRRRRIPLRHRYRLRDWRPRTRRCWPDAIPVRWRSGWTAGASACSSRSTCSWPSTCSHA